MNNTEPFTSFTCCECGEAVDLAHPSGQTRDSMLIPFDMVLPICPRCGELYLDEARAIAVDDRLRSLPFGSYSAANPMITKIRVSDPKCAKQKAKKRARNRHKQSGAK
jgi:predicted RNA-binding Zn-ribbon protein involved in translation (DUF1610 family)